MKQNKLGESISIDTSDSIEEIANAIICGESVEGHEKHHDMTHVIDMIQNENRLILSSFIQAAIKKDDQLFEFINDWINVYAQSIKVDV